MICSAKSSAIAVLVSNLFVSHEGIWDIMSLPRPMKPRDGVVPYNFTDVLSADSFTSSIGPDSTQIELGTLLSDAQVAGFSPGAIKDMRVQGSCSLPLVFVFVQPSYKVQHSTVLVPTVVFGQTTVTKWTSVPGLTHSLDLPSVQWHAMA